MNIPINQILNLLVTYPGNIIYHLVLAFSIMSALQIALINVNFKTSDGNRLILGFSVLLMGQVILFISSGLAAQGLTNPEILLPPLDRGIMTLTSLWLVWLWCYPNPTRTMDILHFLLNIIIIIAAVFTITVWTGSADILKFNQTWLDTAWQGSSALILLVGIAILLFKKFHVWGVGIGFFAILFIGTIAHMVSPQLDGNFAGAVRLAQICAFPLLPTLAKRVIIPIPRKQPDLQTSSEHPAVQGCQNPIDERTLQSWLELASQRKPEDIANSVTQAVARTLVADICLLVTPPDMFGQVILQSGFDLIREEIIPGASLDHHKIPTLSNSIQLLKPLRITSKDARTVELSAIGEVIQLTDIGNLMYIPLTNNVKKMGGLLLLSPYSHHEWTAEEQSFLVNHGSLLSQILLRAYESPAVEKPNQELIVKLETLKKENQTLLQEISLLREAPEPVSQPSPEIDHLRALQKEAQDTIENLLSENEILRNSVPQSINNRNTERLEQAENELKITLEEVARLQNTLVEANGKILDLQDRINKSGGINFEEREVVASIIQELRQPLSSILGYNDLLLGESVGILGALQRKFLERIRSSTERMRSLIEDLLRIIMMEEEKNLQPEPVELGSIIDASINETSGQLRSKNISLGVDIPEVLPILDGNREALQKILTHLLQNAGTVTPIEGSINLRIAVDETKIDQPQLVIEVIDGGGGIPPEELPHIFSRKYRVDNPVIQGLGDTSIGLSIVKSLVEAHGGTIKVDSLLGESTTFTVILPIQSQTQSGLSF